MSKKDKLFEELYHRLNRIGASSPTENVDFCQQLRVKDMELLINILNLKQQKENELRKEVALLKEKKTDTTYDKVLLQNYVIPKAYAKQWLKDAILAQYPEDKIDIESSVRMSIGVLEAIDKKIRKA